MAVEIGGGAGGPSSRPPATSTVKPTFGAQPRSENSQGMGGPDVTGPAAGRVGISPESQVVSPPPQLPDLTPGYPAPPPLKINAASNVDWADAFWGSLGLPPELIRQINAALAGYTDSTLAMAVGQNLIRQSSWFAQNYPGFNTGLTAGLYTDETGYRNYVGQLNQLTQAFLGRPVTVNDTLSYLGQGLDTTDIGHILQGNAYAAANAPELKYELGAFGQGQPTQQQLQAYGQAQSGYQTSLGEQMKTQVDQAIKRMQTVFTGKFATPAGLTMGAQGLNAPGLLGAKTPTSGLSNQVPAT